MATKFRLPRRRFLRLRNGKVDLALGLFLAAIIDAQLNAAAAAEGASGAGGAVPDQGSVPAPIQLPAGFDVDSIKSMTIDELKALLTPELLAQLGLNNDFLELLDADLKEAMRALEAAFRTKLVEVAESQGGIQSGGAASAEAGQEEAGASDGDAGEGGLSPLLIIGGVVLVGGALAFGLSGGSDGAVAAPQPNRAPVATADTFTVAEDGTVTINVLANDTDADGNTLTITQVNGTAISTTSPVTIAGVGVVSLGANGQLTFVPVANYNGAANFTYTISDGNGGTATGNVTGTVTPVNDAPVAVADTFTVAEDGTVTINVRANDTDVDGNTLTITAVNGTAISTTSPVTIAGIGVVSLTANGQLTFVPVANYNGPANFTYTISDGNGGTATANVTGTVTPVNDAPVAVADTFTVAEDGSVTINVLANDTDVDGNVLTITQVNGTAISTTSPVTIAGVGVVSLGANGQLTFVPVANYNGAANFTYTISDGNGGTATGNVTGTVTPVNDAPVAVADTFTVAEDGSVTINVLANDTDVDGNVLTITQVNGTAISTTSPVTIAGVGVVSLGANGQLTFVPVANYNGAANFTYTISDGNGGSATGNVTGTVTPVNDAPVAVADTFTVVEDGSVTFNVLANDTDVDGNALTITQVNGTAISTTSPVTIAGVGVVSLGANGQLTFVPVANYNGAANFTYTISDGNGGSATGNVTGTVTPVNDAPVAVADTFTVVEDGSVTFNVLANDTDVDGNALTITQVNGTAISTTSPVTIAGVGVVSLGANGQLTFVPVANYNGAANFTYTISDGNGGTATGNVTGTVTPVNDAPVAVADTFTVVEDGSVTFNVLANDTDVDGNALTITQVNGTAISTTSPVTIAGVGVVSLGANGQLTFVPVANYNGAANFTYTISDGNGGSATGNVTGTVTPVNDAPVAVADTFTVVEDGSVTFNVLANDTDVDGNTLSVTAVNGTAISTTSPVTIAGVGVVSLGANGQLTFVPVANYNGAANFTYTISDGNGGTATGNVTGTVTPVNDAPVNALPTTFGATSGVAVTVAGLSISDPDGASGTFTTTLSVGNGTLSIATVAGGATISGSGTGSITITGTMAQVNAALATTSFTSGTGFTGSTSLTMTTSDGALSDTDTLTLSVAAVQAGRVQDGYISGATVFYDADGDGIRDADEPFGTTDAQGRYSFALPPGSTGVVIAMGGVNVDSGVPNVMPLKSLVGSSVVNPLTTFVATLVQGGASPAAANASVLAALGLPAGVDLANFDFLAPGGDPAVNLAFHKAAAQIAQLFTDAVAAGVNPNALIGAIASSIGGGAALDLTNAGALADLLVAAGVDPSQAASLAADTAQVNQAIQAATSSDDIGHVQNEYNVPGNNAAPVAADDSLSTQSATVELTGPSGVLANDVDANGDSLRIVAINGVPLANWQAVGADQLRLDVEGGTVFYSKDTGNFSFQANAYGTYALNYTVTDGKGGFSSATVSVNYLPPAPTNVAPVLGEVSADIAVGGSGVVALDASDANNDSLTITQIDGIAIAPGGSVDIVRGGVVIGTVTYDASAPINQALTFAPVPGYVGNANFAYTVSDGQASVSGTANVAVVLAGAVITIDVADLDAYIANSAALAAAGLTTIVIDTDDMVLITVAQATALVASGIEVTMPDEANGDLRVLVSSQADMDALPDPAALVAAGVEEIAVGAPVTVSEAYVLAMLAADLEFDGVDFDTDAAQVTIQLAGATTTLTLFDVADVVEGAIIKAAPGTTALTIGLGSSIVDLVEEIRNNGADDLPRFDAALAVTVVIPGGVIPANDPNSFPAVALNLTPAMQALKASGVDLITTAGGAPLAMTVAQASSIATSGLDIVDAVDLTLNIAGAQAAGLLGNAGFLNLLQALDVDHLNAAGNVSLTAAHVQALAVRGVDFTNVSTVVMTASGAVAVTVEQLQRVNVDSVIVNGPSIELTSGDIDFEDDTLPTFRGVGAANPMVTVRLPVGAIEPDSDVSGPAAALVAAGVDRLAFEGDRASLTAEQAVAFTEANLDITDATDLTVTLTESQLDNAIESLVDGDSALTFLDADHLDLVGNAATISDADAQVLIDAGISFDDSDTGITLVADGTQLNTSLHDLQELGVDTIIGGPGVGHISVSLGAAGLAGLSAGAIPAFADSLDVSLDVDAGTLGATDLSSLAGSLAAAGIDHIGVVNDGALSLSFAQQQALDAVGIDFDDAASVTVTATDAQVAALAADAGLDDSGIDTIDVVDNAVTITEAEAQALIDAGVSFADDDTGVTLVADGTQLNTSLHDLQELGVDSIIGGPGVGHISVSLGAAGLAGLSAGAIPAFADSLDVSLDVDAGTLGATDLSSLAGSLAAAGIDHIGVVGDGALSLSFAQQQALDAAGIDFDAAAAITVVATDAQVSALAADAGLDDSGIDTIDVADDAASISAQQAAALIDAGVSFSAEDEITVIADGTQLSTSLADLAELGVDSVADSAGLGKLSVSLGVALGSGSLANVPSFLEAQSDSDLQVTAVVGAGTIGDTVDLSSDVQALSDAGVDTIGVEGNGALSIQDSHASVIVDAGMDFDADATITVVAHGTELSTSLKGLQDLHIDKVAVQSGVTALHVAAGDLSQVEASDLPQFNVAQSDVALDVTLRVSIDDLADLSRLGSDLAAAGVDHFGLDQDPSSYTPAQQQEMADITAATGINFVYDPGPAPMMALFSMAALPAEETGESVATDADPIEVLDGAVASLFESGMLNAFTADQLVVDATDAGDQLQTTLRDIATYHIDKINVDMSDGGPTYVHIGALGDGGIDEIQALFDQLTGDSGPQSIFSGNSEIALVVDAEVAYALSQVSGAFEHLASIGFTEVDVLGGTDADAFATDAVEVKIIGQDDDLFHQLGGDR